METSIDRRRFLKGSGALGLTLVFELSTLRDAESGAKTDRLFRPNGSLTIDTYGKVVVHIDKAEMGQGVMTALAQIVAEELEADWSDVSFVLKPYTVDQGFVFTASSLSIYTSFDSVSLSLIHI